MKEEKNNDQQSYNYFQIPVKELIKLFDIPVDVSNDSKVDLEKLTQEEQEELKDLKRQSIQVIEKDKNLTEEEKDKYKKLIEETPLEQIKKKHNGIAEKLKNFSKQVRKESPKIVRKVSTKLEEVRRTIGKKVRSLSQSGRKEGDKERSSSSNENNDLDVIKEKEETTSPKKNKQKHIIFLNDEKNPFRNSEQILDEAIKKLGENKEDKNPITNLNFLRKKDSFVVTTSHTVSNNTFFSNEDDGLSLLRKKIKNSLITFEIILSFFKDITKLIEKNGGFLSKELLITYTQLFSSLAYLVQKKPIKSENEEVGEYFLAIKNILENTRFPLDDKLALLMLYFAKQVEYFRHTNQEGVSDLEEKVYAYMHFLQEQYAKEDIFPFLSFNKKEDYSKLLGENNVNFLAWLEQIKIQLKNPDQLSCDFLIELYRQIDKFVSQCQGFDGFEPVLQQLALLAAYFPNHPELLEKIFLNEKKVTFTKFATGINAAVNGEPTFSNFIEQNSFFRYINFYKYSLVLAYTRVLSSNPLEGVLNIEGWKNQHKLQCDACVKTYNLKVEVPRDRGSESQLLIFARQYVLDEKHNQEESLREEHSLKI